ncbi:MAG: low affinity iron permease family protein [Candidatus Saccharimonadales bacterium]
MAQNKTDKPDMFTRFSTQISTWIGRPWMFVIALALLVFWAASGPLLGFSETWQLIVNTSTTIVTFLIVFIIQNTQNRDNMAMNIKLDALIKKANISDKMLLEAEDLSDKKIERKKQALQK